MKLPAHIADRIRHFIASTSLTLLEVPALGRHVLDELRFGAVRKRMIRSAEADVTLLEKLVFPARLFGGPAERADTQGGVFGHEGELLRGADPLLVFPARGERGSEQSLGGSLGERGIAVGVLFEQLDGSFRGVAERVGLAA